MTSVRPYLIGICVTILSASWQVADSKESQHTDTPDFWKEAPADIAARYDSASVRFNEDWVLGFADTLEALGANTHQTEYTYYANELRCHHAFNQMDSTEFYRRSDQCLSLARKINSADRYYAEMMNRAGFQLNARNIHEALMTSQQIISEAYEEGVPGGLYYGYYSLGTIYNTMGDHRRSKENYTKAIYNISGKEEQQRINRAQVYDLLAFNSLEAGDYFEALGYARKSLDNSDTEPDIPACLALAYYHLGDYDNFRQNLGAYFGQTANSSVAQDYYSAWLSLLENAIDGEFDEAMEICETFEDSYEV